VWREKNKRKVCFGGLGGLELAPEQQGKNLMGKKKKKKKMRGGAERMKLKYSQPLNNLFT